MHGRRRLLIVCVCQQFLRGFTDFGADGRAVSCTDDGADPRANGRADPTSRHFDRRQYACANNAADANSDVLSVYLALPNSRTDDAPGVASDAASDGTTAATSNAYPAPKPDGSAN